MWKNSGDRKREQSIKVVYEINGLNLDRFINTVKRKGIALYDVKKYGVKRLVIAVNLSDSENFFAITKELCYNIKKVRYKGKGYPLYYLLKNLGLVIGLALFLAVAIFSNDIILETTFTGSGSVYSREVSEYLKSVGVEKYSRFSSVNLKSLGSNILKNTDKLSFASCKKKGNRLEIQLVLSSDSVNTLSGNVYELYADATGVIEKIKVYRGTAMVNVGDTVKKGDLLVGGFAVIKEQTVKINLLATVTVLQEQTVYYRSEKTGQENIASALAEAEFTAGEIVSVKTTTEKDKNQYLYKTVIKYRRVYFAG